MNFVCLHQRPRVTILCKDGVGNIVSSGHTGWKRYDLITCMIASVDGLALYRPGALKSYRRETSKTSLTDAGTEPGRNYSNCPWGPVGTSPDIWDQWKLRPLYACHLLSAHLYRNVRLYEVQYINLVGSIWLDRTH